MLRTRGPPGARVGVYGRALISSPYSSCRRTGPRGGGTFAATLIMEGRASNRSPRAVFPEFAARWTPVKPPTRSWASAGKPEAIASYARMRASTASWPVLITALLRSCRSVTANKRVSRCLTEAPVGIEPTNSRFAVCRLTTWPRRRARKLTVRHPFPQPAGHAAAARPARLLKASCRHD